MTRICVTDQLREQFIVCFAAAYPDPLACRNLEDARRYAATLKPAEGYDRVVVKRRIVSDWVEVE